MITSTFAAPIGIIRLKSSEKGLERVEIVNTKEDHTFNLNKGLNNYIVELNKYFDGTRTSFDFPLDATGTDFQKAVWNAASSIPYGETRTYQEIAEMIGRPLAVRAVGTALGKNPLCIVVPCHRVLPKSGGIGEYAYGSAAKEWLLAHEKAHMASSASLTY